MKTKLKKGLWMIAIFVSSLLFPEIGKGQNVLDTYINEGLQNNIVLQQKDIALDKAMIAIKTANSLFLPSVNYNGAYTSAEGGRYSNLPIGDLINPVYSTLNQLTGSNSFPTVANQQINFLPHNYYDTYVRTSMPIINTDLIYSRSVEKQKIQLKEFEIDIYKRELIKNIKTAYYNYLAAEDAVKIYSSALNLVNKNIAVNQSLVVNGKGLPTGLLRAQSELENVKAQMNDAENQLKNAQFYFNFLLNRDQNAPVTIDEISNKTDLFKAEDIVNRTDVTKREELKMIQQSSTISTTVLTMNKLFWVPKVNAFLDLGSQGTNWEFSHKSRYYMVGVNVGVPIFNGFRNNYKIKQSILDTKITQLDFQNTTQQLQMSAEISRNNLATAFQNYQAATQRLKSAESYFKLIDKGYNEGVNSSIEFIDARSQLTNSKLQVNINTYKVLAAMATLERETASYSLVK
jgi:outer membrane protein